MHRRIHTQEKPHVCTICNRAFSRVFLLQIHQRTHTGERPFSCEDCGKPFNQQGDLAAHRRTHTGERPHQCDICGKGFIKSSGLTLHRKKHEQQQHTEKVHMVLIDTKDYGLPTSEHAVVDIAPGDMVIEDVIISSWGKLHRVFSQFIRTALVTLKEPHVCWIILNAFLWEVIKR